jgi:hypothetical protein
MMKGIASFFSFLIVGLAVISCSSVDTVKRDTETKKPAMETTLGKSLEQLKQLLHPLELQDLGNNQYIVADYPAGAQLCYFTFEDGKVLEINAMFLGDQFESLTEFVIKQAGEPAQKKEGDWRWYKPGLLTFVYLEEVKGGTITHVAMKMVKTSFAGTWRGTNSNGVTVEYQFDSNGGGTYKIFNPDGTVRLDSEPVTYTENSITDYLGPLELSAKRYVMDTDSAGFILTESSGEKVVFNKVQ